jgi:hypothetical protein
MHFFCGWKKTTLTEKRKIKEIERNKEQEGKRNKETGMNRKTVRNAFEK